MKRVQPVVSECEDQPTKPEKILPSGAKCMGCNGCKMKNRGTWFSHGHKSCHELDGFIMKSTQRHKFIEDMVMIQNMTLSEQ